jgi:hypothetical protein
MTRKPEKELSGRVRYATGISFGDFPDKHDLSPLGRGEICPRLSWGKDQLSAKERDELVANCDRFTKMKHSSALPHAFTEAGVAMLSSVLNSETAIQINLQIVRAFIRLRRMLIDHDALRLAIEGLERRVGKNERDIQMAIKAIQSILTPPDPPKRNFRIGFCPPEKKE